jgi:type IX secretion system PorP/SprF family membrane protein
VVLNVFVFYSANAQDPHFSQFYNQPVQNNPAFAGLGDGLRLGGIYRNLWQKIPGKFNTLCFAADIEALNYGGGLGIVAASDVEGEGYLSTNYIGGIYSYRFAIVPKHFIVQVGFQTTYVTQKIDFSKLVFSDQLDNELGKIYNTSAGALPPIAPAKSFVDFTVGAVTRFNKVRRRKILHTHTIGFAVHHLTNPDQSLLYLNARLPLKFSFQYNSVFPFNNPDSKNPGLLVPALLFEWQKDFRETVLGLNLVKAPLFGGVFFRNRSLPGVDNNVDAVIANIGVEMKPSNRFVLRFTYSYDVTINNLRGYSPGSHEIGLHAILKDIYFKKGNNDKKKIDCYSF